MVMTLHDLQIDPQSKKQIDVVMAVVRGCIQIWYLTYSVG